MRIHKLLPLIILLVAAEAQNDPPGFITIDCGLTNNKSYIDSTTGLTYITDDGFINTGEARHLPEDKYVSQSLWTLRIFPQGNRNCYTIKTLGGKGSRYLIRATFYHGGYDGSLAFEKYNFDLHLGQELWETVEGKSKESIWKEIIHTLSSDSLSICLVKTGESIPFISLLELRPSNTTWYPQSTSLKVVERLNFNPGSATATIIRYPDDIYDRFWTYSMDYFTERLYTKSTIDNTKNIYQVPSVVMSTARLAYEGKNLYYNWTSESEYHQYYLYLHFAELTELESNRSREFNLYVNADLWKKDGPFSPSYLTPETLTKTGYLHGYRSYSLQLYNASGSTEPPIINAAEIYLVQNFTVPETYYQDVEALSNMKTTYGIAKNWQGDPCAPKAFIWEGVTCIYGDVQQIISLNLSKSDLEGAIDPAISKLSKLETLDLSNNRLTGEVPDFLAQLDSLKVLNLVGNYFNGTIPRSLSKKSNAGGLSLSFDEENRPISEEATKKKINLVIPISVAATLLLLLGVLVCICTRTRKGVSKINIENHILFNKEVSNEDLATGKENHSEETKILARNDSLIKTKKFKFAYDEVVTMTNNFQRVLGEGGFGKVYYGYIDGIEVAVKMLSKLSQQGSKEFQAEANLLMTIHHKNLLALVGYYYEGSNMGIIYEYMQNGTLEGHLFENSRNVLTWAERLQIAIDSAQDSVYQKRYLSYNISRYLREYYALVRYEQVHRDIKTTNILLDDKFQAKLADFGLSRAFPVGGVTHVSTVVAGTLGYLDPESYATGRITEKSDVYSFGVVLLEIITGRQAITRTNGDQTHVVSWVSSELDTGDITKVVDKRLNNEEFANSGWRYLELAMACVARESENRPTMIYVSTTLQECLAMHNPQMSVNASMSKLELSELWPPPR